MLLFFTMFLCCCFLLFTMCCCCCLLVLIKASFVLCLLLRNAVLPVGTLVDGVAAGAVVLLPLGGY